MKYFLLLLFLTSCSTIIEDLFSNGWCTYSIYRGNHFSIGNRSLILTSNKLYIKVKFSSSCIYELDSDQGDINKLIGFTDCYGLVHDNSARLGWRWNTIKQKIEIFTYTYNQGKVNYLFITDANIDSEYNASISISNDKYIYSFDNISLTINRGCSNNVNIGTILYPYFGGNRTAPHDIFIKIKYNF